jgi:hypothetical protein
MVSPCLPQRSICQSSVDSVDNKESTGIMFKPFFSVIVTISIFLCSLLTWISTANAQTDPTYHNQTPTTDTTELSPQFIDNPVVNYQAPCKPGTEANVTTWHKNGGIDNRRAYDWRCHRGTNNGGYDVYAPHGGKVKTQINRHPEYGTIFIEDTENNACTILFHMQTEFKVEDGQIVTAGEPIGQYFAEDKCVAGSCAGWHVHLIAQDGLCSSNNYVIDRAKERPIRFNEFGQLLSPRITLDGTEAGNTGARKWITVGECAGNLAPCIVPKDNDLPTGHLSDVPLNHPFFPYIETLYYLKVVSGNSQGNYEPDRDLKRGEAAKIIILGSNEYREYNDGQCAFTDVCPGHVHYHTIRRLKELGITSADQPLFNPDNALTRGGMAKFVVLAYDRQEPSSTCVGEILGVPCTNTFYKYVRRLQQIFDNKGFTLGNSQGQFNPDDSVKRGEAAKLAVIGLGLEEYLPKFYDVPHDSKFLRYINAIAERGITQGCDTSSSYPKFCPDQFLTRGQAAAFIVRSVGLTPFFPSGQSFSDTSREHTFFHHIEYLARQGIVTGFSDGTFRPDNAITRGEIAKIIINTLNQQGFACQPSSTPVFSDVDNSHVFFPFIQCLAHYGITHGYSDGLYRPNQTITRAEAAKFIYEAFIAMIAQHEQESSDQANNEKHGASLLTSGLQVMLPSSDVDWLKFVVPTSAIYATNTMVNNAYLLTLAAEINVQMEFRIENASGQTILFTPASELFEFEGAPLQSEQALLLTNLSPGEYGIRLSNQKLFAAEGVLVEATITAIDPNHLPPSHPGDVTCDNLADVNDVLSIIQYDVGLRQPANSCPLSDNTFYIPACDVNANGDCEVGDALLLLQCDVGIPNSFCPIYISANEGTQNGRPQQTFLPFVQK